MTLLESSNKVTIQFHTIRRLITLFKKKIQIALLSLFLWFFFMNILNERLEDKKIKIIFFVYPIQPMLRSNRFKQIRYDIKHLWYMKCFIFLCITVWVCSSDICYDIPFFRVIDGPHTEMKVLIGTYFSFESKYFFTVFTCIKQSKYFEYFQVYCLFINFC